MKLIENQCLGNLTITKTHLNVWVLVSMLLFSIMGCSPPKKGVEEIALAVDSTFSELSDSSFVPPRVMCLAVKDDNFYFSNYSDGVVVLYPDFKFSKRIGSRGEGPGELLGCGHIYVGNNDSIYALNEGKHSIEVFVKDKHVSHISFPKNVSLSFSTRFFLHNQCVYHSVIGDSLAAIIFDNSSSINRYICDYTRWDDPKLARHSSRHLVKGVASFFVVGCALPIFQRYSFSGKLLEEYNLEDLPKISRMIEKYKRESQEPTNYFTIIQDAYYYDEKIYLLVATNENEYFCNTIYVLDVSGKTKHIQTFKLSGDVYETFCVKGNFLVAFNSMNACIDRFKLP